MIEKGNENNPFNADSSALNGNLATPNIDAILEIKNSSGGYIILLQDKCIAIEKLKAKKNKKLKNIKMQ